jgi:ATP-binding cassette, subfamily F, member 2
MPPKVSQSKLKRLEKKQGKGSALGSVTESTPNGSTIGSEASTPMTNLSAAASKEDLNAMAKLQIATDRCAYIYR